MSVIKMSLAVGTRVGSYSILGTLGAGAMGEVYRARDTKLGRDVALKVLPEELASDPERLRRFEHEARSASSLNHPNIITIYDIGAEGSTHYIAMELVDGKTLRELLASGALETEKLLPLAIQAAKGLAKAHAAGIVHRDLKPDNLMVTEEGFLKILDFGLAKSLAPSGGASSEMMTVAKEGTTPGMILGTIGYMSPEQARSEDLDSRSDQFSFGSILYEMLTKRKPFQKATAFQTLTAIVEAQPNPIARVNPGAPLRLVQIVERCLAKNPEDRYSSTSDLARELEGIRTTDVVGDVTTGERRQTIDSLAVLPFTNLTDDPNAEYLSDGITESIINSLSQLPGLRVIARFTVFRYKGREVDPSQVGRELQVRAVLMGRVLQMGNRLVIRTELVDAAEGSQLWGEQYNRQPSDIFLVQEEIAGEITEKLRLALTGEQKKQVFKRYTDNTEAYQLYLRGRYAWNKRTAASLKKGVELFKQAIETDPTYALAYAGLADSYTLLERYSVSRPHDVMPQAKAAAKKALEIDDALAEAHAAMGMVSMYYDWNWDAADREFKRAIELNPGYASAHHRHAWHLAKMGRHAEAEGSIRQAQELDPLSLIINANVGTLFYFARQYDRAAEQLKKTLDLDPDFAVAHQWLGRTYEQLAQHQEAIAEHRRAADALGEDPECIASLGRAYALAGQSKEALEALERLEELSQKRFVSPYWPAIVYVGMGKNDDAMESLEKAFEERFDWLNSLNVEPMFDTLRSYPRFSDLMRRIGLPE